MNHRQTERECKSTDVKFILHFTSSFSFFPDWLAEGRPTFGHLSDSEAFISMNKLIPSPSKTNHFKYGTHFTNRPSYVRTTLRQLGLKGQSTT